MPDDQTTTPAAAADPVAEALDAAVKAVTAAGLAQDDAGDAAAFDRAIAFRRDLMETRRRWIAGEPARQQRARRGDAAQAEG